MIKLRLKRFGKKNQASFRIVAVNSTSRRNGEPLEELGFYNPRTERCTANRNCKELTKEVKKLVHHDLIL
jgi:small subunit ribosomal protein S16